MELNLQTARWAASISWALNFGAQLYGMLATPNMKQVHDDHISFYSPNPFFIACFFFPQQLIQLGWLWRMWGADKLETPTSSDDIALMVRYTPFFALGNFSIAAWMIFWTNSNLQLSNFFVAINTIAQLYFCFFLLPQLNLNSLNSALTHLVSKTFAGIAVLDIMHNTSVAYFDHQAPPFAVLIVTPAIYLTLAAAGDWIFGACMVYDLVALAVGQAEYGNRSWGIWLGIFAGATAVVGGMKNFTRPPYIRRDTGYHPV